jgi:hypothetical protein
MLSLALACVGSEENCKNRESHHEDTKKDKGRNEIHVPNATSDVPENAVLEVRAVTENLARFTK